MGDETSAALRLPSTLLEHYCEEPGCKVWGSLGYDIGKDVTRWYCFEHKWKEYPLPKGGKPF
ncbi:hypothetical protein G6L95_06605 [Agrobacterium rhizogenes]|nr:hypothetical protein [Rhizobium rhizogenes]NTI54621.1 hypothetical protein [Rhizobium rhizogenes]